MFLTFGMASLLCACTGKQEIKVLQLNIWQEGTKVEGGYDALVDELARIDADFVMLSEVRNYDGTRFCDRITESLAEKKLRYYSFYSYDSGLLSKYPITDSTVVFPENGDHGSIYKLTANVKGQNFCVYTAHLDYKNCAYYMVRGYDGSTWDKLPAPETNVDTLLKVNTDSQRDDAIHRFLEDSRQEIARGSLVFLGGDFNEPSHHDWTEQTKDSADHHGVIIPWTVTTLLEAHGFKDSYRERYPDPVKYPGYTYPADCKGVDVKRLTWAPESDERERIDFIFYHPDPRLQLKESYVHGPKTSIRNSQRMEEESNDPFITPLNIWPTDHKGVLSIFSY
jgi:endonuclease/exonuclease/phosphatase family metal-dependent hydrolase